MPLIVTMLIAAALALVNLWLSFRIVRLRWGKRISVGHANDPVMEARMRAHANFSEYVPLALILMALIEAQAGASMLLWALGAALVLGRLLHPFGLERPAPNALRAAGMGLTWLATIALIVWALYLVTTTRTGVPGGAVVMG